MPAEITEKAKNSQMNDEADDGENESPHVQPESAAIMSKEIVQRQQTKSGDCTQINYNDITPINIESSTHGSQSLLQIAEVLKSDSCTDSSTGNGINTSGAGSECGSDVGDKKNLPLSMAGFDVLRFKNNFLEVVEELRMRRAIDTENEKHMKQLTAEKHDLQQKLEDELTHSNCLTEGHTHQQEETRKQHEEQIKQIRDEKAKSNLSAESRGMELKSFKDEIRALHLAKYNLEKKVQEQDRQLQLQSTSRDSYLSQISQLEHKCSLAFKQADDITEQMERLETNVKQAAELHNKLQYVNEHQNCELDKCCSKLEVCRAELIECRVHVAADTDGETGDDKMVLKMRNTEQELKMQVELNKQLQAQMLSMRNEHQGVVQQLKEAHALIERHMDSSTKLGASEALMQEEVGDLKAKCESLEETHNNSMEAYKIMEEKYSTEKKEWNQKCEDIEHRLKTLQNDYASLQKSHEQLEEAKSVADKEIDSLVSGFEKTREKLEEELKLSQSMVEEYTHKEKEWSQSMLEVQQALDQCEMNLAQKEKMLQVKTNYCADVETKLNVATAEQPPPTPAPGNGLVLQSPARSTASIDQSVLSHHHPADTTPCLHSQEKKENKISVTEATSVTTKLIHKEVSSSCGEMDVQKLIVPLPPSTLNAVGDSSFSPEVMFSSQDSLLTNNECSPTSAVAIKTEEEPVTEPRIYNTKQNLSPIICLERVQIQTAIPLIASSSQKIKCEPPAEHSITSDPQAGEGTLQPGIHTIDDSPPNAKRMKIDGDNFAEQCVEEDDRDKEKRLNSSPTSTEFSTDLDVAKTNKSDGKKQINNEEVNTEEPVHNSESDLKAPNSCSTAKVDIKDTDASNDCGPSSHDLSDSLNDSNEEKTSSPVIIFSDDDDELLGGMEEESHTTARTKSLRSRMLNTQMNNQIERVETFLKMDRLRKTKPLK